MSQTGEPYSSELAKLEQELQILRERYDLLKWSGELLRKFFLITSIALTPLFTIISFLFLNWRSGVGLMVIGAGVSLLCYIAVKGSSDPWVAPGYTNRGYKVSEATVLPDMIAEREARIAEIKRMLS